MQFMLDTNICIYIIKNRPASVKKRLATLSPPEVGISSLTLAELLYGVHKSGRPEKNREALNNFAGLLELSPFDDRCAEAYGEISAHLESMGRVIGQMDMLIAAHAKSLNVTLVSNNIREFKRIPGLKLENWT